LSKTTACDSQGTNDASVERTAILKAYEKPAYRYLVLGILTTVYISNFVDRQVINVLAEPIIADLEISDGQFGMLSGNPDRALG
jgi:sugar phosphate permease